LRILLQTVAKQDRCQEDGVDGKTLRDRKIPGPGFSRVAVDNNAPVIRRRGRGLTSRRCRQVGASRRKPEPWHPGRRAYGVANFSSRFSIGETPRGVRQLLAAAGHFARASFNKRRNFSKYTVS